ncbi:Reverse transcriptase (RNA-dependent DNA polymerase) [Fragilaria crotonensis]|nr:Reverse transcriptase (RNA-dependent DNA polymerase) [Fragilaria crotonensis]
MNKIKARSDYDEIKNEPIALLKAIKDELGGRAGIQTSIILDAMHTLMNQYKAKGKNWKHPLRIQTVYQDDPAASPNVEYTSSRGEQEFLCSAAFKRARRARDLYHALGTPSINDFKAMLQMNILTNNPVTTDDIKIAKKIFGPDIGAFKGKGTQRKLAPVVNDYIEIPKELITAQLELTLLCIHHGMKVNGLAFLTTVSCHIQYRMTAQYIKAQSAAPTEMLWDRSYSVCSALIAGADYNEEEFNNKSDRDDDDELPEDQFQGIDPDEMTNVEAKESEDGNNDDDDGDEDPGCSDGGNVNDRVDEAADDVGDEVKEPNESVTEEEENQSKHVER